MKIAVFYDENVPYHGVRPSASDLAGLSRFGEILGLSGLQRQRHAGEDYDCFVNLHGAFFDKSAWEPMLQGLRSGAGLVCIGGGVPFSIPVREGKDGAVVEREQAAYRDRLNIHHGLHIGRDRYERLAVNPDLPLLEGYEKCFEIADTIGLLVRFTKFRDVPADNGSSGPMDAVLKPLMTGFDGKNRPTAAPAVLIENTKDCYAGGRWVFINQAAASSFWANDGAGLIERLAAYASAPAYELIARPNFASYYPGEQPTLLVQAQNLRPGSRPAAVDLAVVKGAEVVYRKTLDIDINDEIKYLSIPTDIRAKPGIYKLLATVRTGNEPIRVYRNGFWGYDRELMESGGDLSCGRDYFYRDGKPLPIVGMTYMQSDVHRKYLYLPNADAWDRDMAEMKRAGINMIRTGVWTGFRTLAFNDGIVNEDFLRMIDGMALTAKLYDIHLVFNLWAFTPEVWEGCNPYLDPRSLAAQKRYVSAIVGRHSKSRGISWDLINEPSLCTVHTRWRPAPNRDRYEAAEWSRWLKEKHGCVEALREKWNCTPAELPDLDHVALPEEIDFERSVTHSDPVKSQKVIDYIHFTNHVMNLWAAEMVKTIRSAGSGAPITIGQDEGLNARRPSPLFYQETMDYTTCHSWWLNDDLYWDGVFSKSPSKPSLIQETGIMFVQTAEGKPRRSEEELRNLLERKYALAFASDNCGAVQWIWNINVYMSSYNEINIGAVRADGTQKLEADVSYDFGDFIGAVGSLFEDRRPEEVAIVFPYSNNFSVRDYATAATKRAARLLGYDLNIGFKAYGEYHLDGIEGDRLLILPCPRSFSQAAWSKILEKVSAGCTLLVTGPISYDDYFGRVPGRSVHLGLDTQLKNIAREEVLHIDGVPYRAAFGGSKYEWIEKEAVRGAEADELKVIPCGSGRIVWSPIPVELNEEDGVVREVYRKAVEIAGVVPDFTFAGKTPVGILGKKLSFRNGAVYVFVSELGCRNEIKIRDTATGKLYSFELPPERSVLFATDKGGRLLKAYRDWNITTNTEEVSL